MKYVYIYRYAQQVVGFNETRGISWLFIEIMNRICKGDTLFH